MIPDDFLNIADETKTDRDYKFNRWYNKYLVDSSIGNGKDLPKKVTFNNNIDINKYTLSLPISEEQFADFFNIEEKVLDSEKFADPTIMAKMFAKKPMGFQREDGKKTGYNNARPPVGLFIPEFLPSPGRGNKYEFAKGDDLTNAIGSAQNLFTQCTLESLCNIYEYDIPQNFSDKMLEKPMREFFSDYMSSIFDFIPNTDPKKDSIKNIRFLCPCPKVLARSIQRGFFVFIQNDDDELNPVEKNKLQTVLPVNKILSSTMNTFLSKIAEREEINKDNVKYKIMEYLGQARSVHPEFLTEEELPDYWKIPGGGEFAFLTIKCVGQKVCKDYLKNEIIKQKKKERLYDIGVKIELFKASPQIAAKDVAESYFHQILHEEVGITNWFCYNFARNPEMELYKRTFEYAVDGFHDWWGDRTNIAKKDSNCWESTTGNSVWADNLGFLWPLTIMDAYGMAVTDEQLVVEVKIGDDIFFHDVLLPKLNGKIEDWIKYFKKRSSLPHKYAELFFNTKLGVTFKLYKIREFSIDRDAGTEISEPTALLIGEYTLPAKKHLKIVSDSRGTGLGLYKKYLEIPRVVMSGGQYGGRVDNIKNALDRIHGSGGILSVTGLNLKGVEHNLKSFGQSMGLLLPNRMKKQLVGEEDFVPRINDENPSRMVSNDSVFVGPHFLKDSTGTSTKIPAALLGYDDFSKIEESSISAIKDASIGNSNNPRERRPENGFNLSSITKIARAAIPCYTMPYYYLRDNNGNIESIVFVMYIPELAPDKNDSTKEMFWEEESGDNEDLEEKEEEEGQEEQKTTAKVVDSDSKPEVDVTVPKIEYPEKIKEFFIKQFGILRSNVMNDDEEESKDIEEEEEEFKSYHLRVLYFVVKISDVIDAQKRINDANAALIAAKAALIAANAASEDGALKKAAKAAREGVVNAEKEGIAAIYKKAQDLVTEMCIIFVNIPYCTIDEMTNVLGGIEFYTYIQKPKNGGVRFTFGNALKFGLVEAKDNKKKPKEIKAYDKELEDQNKRIFDFMNSRWTQDDIVIETKEGVVAMDMVIGLHIMIQHASRISPGAAMGIPVCCRYLKGVCKEKENAKENRKDQIFKNWAAGKFTIWERAFKFGNIPKSKGDETRKFGAIRNIMLTVDGYLHKNCIVANVNSIKTKNSGFEIYFQPDPKVAAVAEDQDPAGDAEEKKEKEELILKTKELIKNGDLKNLLLVEFFENYELDGDEEDERLLNIKYDKDGGNEFIMEQDLYYLHYFLVNLIFMKLFNILFKLTFNYEKEKNIFYVSGENEDKSFIELLERFINRSGGVNPSKARDLEKRLLNIKLLFSHLPDIKLQYAEPYKPDGRLIHIKNFIEDEDIHEISRTDLELYRKEYDDLHRENIEILSLSTDDLKKYTDKYQKLLNGIFNNSTDKDKEDRITYLQKAIYIYNNNIQNRFLIRNFNYFVDGFIDMFEEITDESPFKGGGGGDGDDEEEEAAAKKLQAVVRGRQERKKLQKEVKDVKIVQAITRGRQERKKSPLKKLKKLKKQKEKLQAYYEREIKLDGQSNKFFKKIQGEIITIYANSNNIQELKNVTKLLNLIDDIIKEFSHSSASNLSELRMSLTALIKEIEETELHQETVKKEFQALKKSQKEEFQTLKKQNQLGLKEQMKTIKDAKQTHGDKREDLMAAQMKMREDLMAAQIKMRTAIMDIQNSIAHMKMNKKGIQKELYKVKSFNNPIKALKDLVYIYEQYFRDLTVPSIEKLKISFIYNIPYDRLLDFMLANVDNIHEFLGYNLDEGSPVGHGHGAEAEGEAEAAAGEAEAENDDALEQSRREDVERKMKQYEEKNQEAIVTPIKKPSHGETMNATPPTIKAKKKPSKYAVVESDLVRETEKSINNITSSTFSSSSATGAAAAAVGGGYKNNKIRKQRTKKVRPIKRRKFTIKINTKPLPKKRTKKTVPKKRKHTTRRR